MIRGAACGSQCDCCVVSGADRFDLRCCVTVGSLTSLYVGYDLMATIMSATSETLLFVRILIMCVIFLSCTTCHRAACFVKNFLYTCSIVKTLN